ncbi:competence/damage-inducible protein A [Cerasicoccus arenae]|uniref:CinA-like protein n=1 Tax=Cerasicoccus arenae TaxID=424488 RepID=A0A8J3DAW2_9BACT|nr:competence/damage-inducible protein A [Cerasicoccus arenae]MBK1858154.1 competence/damage-inducible protein A [Cerasicoccus arenae]GHB96816.1 CinA-like protein [Cerasicoccus arenae]
MASPAKVDLITLGDELLLGIRENSHLKFIGGELARHGLALRRNTSCRDTRDEIIQAFREAWMTADIVITTGGLGPTSDDNTREVIAHCLGLELDFVPEIEETIRARFDRMGRTMSENNLKQCYLPRGAELLPNPYGTAPGIYLQLEGKRLFMLPGPASELRPMFKEQVLTRICADGFCSLDDAYLQIRTMGVGESALETKLLPILNANPDVQVAYCAHQGMVDLRLSLDSMPIDFERLRAVGDECREVLGPDFVCFGHCHLAKAIFNYLRAHERTLSVAESCTGGLLSNAFTDIPGASKVFAGGFVCYSNESKMEMLGVPECILQQHGAVSAECAVAMADGAAERLGTDYALSVTGFAGPCGGTPENPVGTIYIGYHSPLGSWCVRMVRPGERTTVKTLAVNRALDVMRRKLHKYNLGEALACECKAEEAEVAE